MTVVCEGIDVLGLAELSRASATLDGSIPLRAAQACSPLLSGNRFGHQVRLRAPIELTGGITGIRAVLPDALARTWAGNAPRLPVEGLIDPKSLWAKRLAGGLVWRERGPGKVIALFTGLLLRPAEGVSLRVSHAGNRRNLLFSVEPQWLIGEGRLVPLVLRLTLGRETALPLRIHGEIATIAPFDPKVRWERARLKDAKALGRAHASFYDAQYFQQKKQGATQKYKHLLAATDKGPSAQDLPGAPNDEAPQEMCARVIEAGPPGTGPAGKVGTLSSQGFGETEAHTERAIVNAVPLDAMFDGHDTFVEINRKALDRYGSETRAAWIEAFGEGFAHEERRAIWYFSKYVTPHQPGEPYFFVKPAALIETPPGVSMLIDGCPGPGYDVLRGVVATDRFHAAPAVLRLNAPGRRVTLDKGVQLARMVPIARDLLDGDMKIETLELPR